MPTGFRIAGCRSAISNEMNSAKLTPDTMYREMDIGRTRNAPAKNAAKPSRISRLQIEFMVTRSFISSQPCATCEALKLSR